MREGTEVITMTDKDKRDRLFEDLRQNGNAEERQVVKFSGVEPVLGTDGKQLHTEKQYWIPGAKHPKVQFRPVFQSNWSVAYPKS